MASSDIRTITLTVDQRDGLYEFVASHLKADSLSHYVERGDAEAAKRLVGSLPSCVRLLDQVGWEVKGNESSYAVTLDAEVFGLLPELASRIAGTIEDDEQTWGMASSEEDEATARRFLNHDRHAQKAVTLMQAVA